MSAYDKPQQADWLDFNTTGALHDPSAHGAFAQPPYAPHLLYPAAFTGHGQDTDHLHYVNAAEFPAQHSFEEHRSSIPDPRTRQRPEVTSYAPQEGSQGSIVSVYLQTVHDLEAPPALSISLLFASRAVDCTIQLLNPGEHLKQYAVFAEVPNFISTAHHSFSVPLRLIMDNAVASSAPLAVEVGAFTYTGQVALPSQPRKRKASSSSDEFLQQPNKKPMNHQLRIQDRNVEAFDYNRSATSPYSPFVPNPTTGPVLHARHNQNVSPRPMGHQYSTSAASAASLKAPSPHSPAWSPSFTTVNKVAHNSIPPPMTPIPRPSAASSPGTTAVPALIRTSTIQPSPSSIGTGTGPSLGNQAFNPYAMLPLKASLNLNGDLDAMAEKWNVEEFEAKRRLVQFSRRQSGSTIHVDFKSIAPEDRPPNSITISCIWWQEKKECFVTSVDTIFLLESLVAARFTVEEKNRIRRNLEGFRPLTVSKSKADSEDFFKVIMGFPNPKPRNIEKDVKVFPWKILAPALKKIISKYSASYSSTAGVLITPATSAYASTESSLDHVPASPVQGSISTALVPYTTSTAPSYSPSLSQQRMSAPVTTGPPTDLRVQLPIMRQSYSIPPNYVFPHPPQMPQSHSPLPQIMSAPVSHAPAPWDFAAFVNASPASMGQGSLSATPYTRAGTSSESQDFMPPTSYSMGHSTTGI